MGLTTATNSGTSAVGPTRRAGRVLGDVVMSLLALGGVICVVLVVLSFVFHVTLIMFKTGSMAPTIPAGSVAIVHRIPATDIEVGDVVTVDRLDQLPVTHRVMSVAGEGSSRIITLKGDANDAPDPLPYDVSEVRRVWLSVPGAATVIVWLSQPIVLGSVALGVAGLVTWAFWPRRSTTVRADPRAGDDENENADQDQSLTEAATA